MPVPWELHYIFFLFKKKKQKKQSNNSAGFGGTSAWNVKPYAMSLIVALKIQTWKCRATQQKSLFCNWFLFVLQMLPFLKFKIYWTLKYPRSVISRAKFLTIGPFSSRAISPSRISRVTYVTVVYSTFKHISLHASVQYFGIFFFPWVESHTQVVHTCSKL